MGDIHRPTGVPLRDRVSHLFLERGTLHASRHSLSFERETGAIEIPCAKAAVLFLEPGTVVTHAAVKMCADHGTLLTWVGEAGVHLYASGLSGGPAGTRILEQARLRLDPRERIEVSRRFHELMFGTKPPPARQIEKLRGIEGGWVKKRYQALGDEHGVEWQAAKHCRGVTRTPLVMRQLRSTGCPRPSSWRPATHLRSVSFTLVTGDRWCLI